MPTIMTMIAQANALPNQADMRSEKLMYAIIAAPSYQQAAGPAEH
jgi:hypothetical protein